LRSPPCAQDDKERKGADRADVTELVPGLLDCVQDKTGTLSAAMARWP
jgi:hypothetical protein